MTKSREKKIIAVVLILLLIGMIGVVFGNGKAEWYTEAEHLERIRKRIQKRYIEGDEVLRKYSFFNNNQSTGHIKATGFEVYPVYDENEQMKYCLVEFQPYGYLYVYIRDEQLKLFSPLGTYFSMYMLSSRIGELPWTPYVRDESAEGGFVWARDENGVRPSYPQSPFAVRGMKDEKRYWIAYETPNGPTFIPAVKRGGKYINLYSNEEFDLDEAKMLDSQECHNRNIMFINKPHFNL